VPAPPGVVMVTRQTLARNGSRTQSKGRAYVGGHEEASKDSTEAGIVHLASLQRVSLIFREDCYNVVT
jgi:hypothetical protein